MRSSLSADWDFERETRSILLRFVAFAILLANLLLGGGAEAEGTHFAVIICYLVISIASVMSARFLPGRSWLKTYLSFLTHCWSR